VLTDIPRGMLPEQDRQVDAIRRRLKNTLPAATISSSAARWRLVLIAGLGEGSDSAMLFVMFTVLMVQLRSFQRLVLVLAVAPLGLIGVVAALLISRMPLGFVAILGVLALLGMITKNAVIPSTKSIRRAQGRKYVRP
jgi:hypothetical protein